VTAKNFTSVPLAGAIRSEPKSELYDVYSRWVLYLRTYKTCQLIFRTNLKNISNHLFLPSCWSVASNTSEYTPEPNRIPRAYRSPGSCRDENVKSAGKEPVSTMVPDTRQSISVARLKMFSIRARRRDMQRRNIHWQHKFSTNVMIFSPGVF